MSDTKELIERLRGQSAGFDEWRVQDPKDGSYCIAYSWPESFFPEREARAWLADHKARFPDSQYADYVVACVRVTPEKDRLLAEAADTIARLTAERDAARGAIEQHNAGCVESCDSRSCAPFLERGRLCPECPRDWMIDLDAIAAMREGEGK